MENSSKNFSIHPQKKPMWSRNWGWNFLCKKIRSLINCKIWKINLLVSRKRLKKWLESIETERKNFRITYLTWRAKSTHSTFSINLLSELNKERLKSNQGRAKINLTNKANTDKANQCQVRQMNAMQRRIYQWKVKLSELSKQIKESKNS